MDIKVLQFIVTQRTRLAFNEDYFAFDEARFLHFSQMDFRQRSAHAQMTSDFTQVHFASCKQRDYVEAHWMTQRAESFGEFLDICHTWKPPLQVITCN